MLEQLKSYIIETETQRVKEFLELDFITEKNKDYFLNLFINKKMDKLNEIMKNGLDICGIKKHRSKVDSITKINGKFYFVIKTADKQKNGFLCDYYLTRG